jgi:hypothetical protein
MESTALASQIARAVPRTLEPEYITVPQAQVVCSLGKSSIYSVIKDPKNKIRTRAFSLGRARRKKVRLIHYGDLLRFLDQLPVDL